MTQIRVLLADDDHDHRHLLLMSLRGASPNIEIEAVSNAEEFREAAGRGEFDAVVLDFSLHDRRADELIDECRSRLGDAPVIVVSSSPEQAVAIASFRVGSADFLPKSEAIKGDVLWRRISSAVIEHRRRSVERRRSVRRERALIRLAETDALTGLPNRRALSRRMASSRSRRDRRRLHAFVMIDIDRFKDINDSLGHDTGDRILKSVADSVRLMLAPGDLAVRWGGEEILVVRSVGRSIEAWSWADRLRDRVAGTVVPIEGGQARATISAGVSVIPTSEMNEDAILLADHALYLAKDRGRNRVCTWEMVRFDRLAGTIGLDADLPIAVKREEFLRRGRGDLGLVQTEHLSRHSEAVAGVATRIAERMRLTPRVRATVRSAALLHDIGKCVIPDSLLSKPAALAPEEWQIMNRHAEEGACLAESLGADPDVVESVRHHHARYESVTEHCPPTASEIGASIVSVADALVTMTSPRPYRAALSSAGALAELKKHSGTQFHPVAADAAREVWREHRLIRAVAA